MVVFLQGVSKMLYKGSTHFKYNGFFMKNPQNIILKIHKKTIKKNQLKTIIKKKFNYRGSFFI